MCQGYLKSMFCSLIAKESDKDLTTWETYLKEKKQKKKKKIKEASKAEESEEDTSDIVITIFIEHTIIYL